jgi:hypothetical protein
MFNGFYCCLIYNIKLELPMNSELLLIAPTSSRHNAKPHVVRRFSHATNEQALCP